MNREKLVECIAMKLATSGLVSDPRYTKDEAKPIAGAILALLPPAPAVGEAFDFNINGTVQVQLTDAGRDAARQYITSLYADYERVTGNKLSTDVKKYVEKETVDGWSEWQLWELIQRLGPQMSMGGPQLIKNNVIRFAALGEGGA